MEISVWRLQLSRQGASLKKVLLQSRLSVEISFFQFTCSPEHFFVFPVQFNLCTYVSPSSGVNDPQPVCLGISKSNFYLACSRPDSSNPPKLELRVSTTTSSFCFQKPSHEDISDVRNEQWFCFIGDPWHPEHHWCQRCHGLRPPALLQETERRGLQHFRIR